MRLLFVAGLVTAAGLAAIAWWRSDFPEQPLDTELARSLPKANGVANFATSNQCRDCHPLEYASWHASYHRTMTQVARPETVAGPFDGTTVEDAGQVHRLRQRDDELWVESSPANEPPPSSNEDAEQLKPVARRAVLATGSHHMQVYWAAGGAGNLLDELPLVYIRDPRPGKSRWAPLRASYLSPSGASSESHAHWNKDCILCHATGGQPGMEGHTGAANTKVAEIGIACEACHGPAEHHVRLERQRADLAAQATTNHEHAHDERTIINPARLHPERAAQVCGHCHAFASFMTESLIDAFLLSGSAYRPGDDLLKTRLTILPARLPPEQNEANRKYNPFYEGSYWPDGMVRVVGREYNGLLESTCYQQGGMTCLSCHSMHQSDPNDQLAASMDGNDACYQCHQSYRQNLADHTHHPEASRGSQCYNCHMPHTTYGLFKAVRSHQISSPSVAITLATGRPTACNMCHLDQTLDWSAEHLSAWYGQPRQALDDEQRALAAAALWLLKGDAVQRALLAWMAGWKPALEVSGADWLPPILAPLLDDPSPVVRMIAWRSLDGLDPRYCAEYDYVGSSTERQAAVHRVVERWKTATGRKRRALPESLLGNSGGDLDEDLLGNLLRDRDDHGLLIEE
ncbi:MAG TPA: multiheme c-type cytochrome [Pirellulales bacterium]|nr:multiheme c-type cytochrome [Pirellulales bacterium]